MRHGWMLWCAGLAYANVEKTIFTAPANLRMTASGGLLNNLCLSKLTPEPSETRLRTSLPVTFPARGSSSRGNSSWYLLEELDAGQRYEVRICWSATQPTDFRLTTHQVIDVFNNETLLQDLSIYSTSKQDSECPARSPQSQSIQSVLFLNIQAAADFYSSDSERMQNPPDVLVDIILDPYLFNLVPQSLLKTGAFIVVLLPVAYLLSYCIWSLISRLEAAKDKVP